MESEMTRSPTKSTFCCEICRLNRQIVISGSFSSSLTDSRHTLAVFSSESSPRQAPTLSASLASLQNGSPRDGGETLLQYVDISEENATDFDAQRSMRDEFEHVRQRKAHLDHLRFQNDEYSLSIAQLAACKLSFEKTLVDANGRRERPVDAVARKRLALLRLREEREMLLRKAACSDIQLNALRERKSRLESEQEEAQRASLVNDVSRHILQDTLTVIENKYELLERMRMLTLWRIFRSFPIAVDLDSLRKVQRDRPLRLQGCSSILGFPLPNNGHYDHVPIDVLNPALGLLSQMLDAISTVLNIPLPHPVRPFALNGVSAITPQFAQDAEVFSLSPLAIAPSRDRATAFRSLSLASVREDLAVSARTRERARARASSASSAAECAPREDELDARDEDGVSVNPHFATALLLLQANVLTLCLRSGLSPGALWPAQAALLNLKTLEVFVERLLRDGKDGEPCAAEEELLLRVPPRDTLSPREDQAAQCVFDALARRWDALRQRERVIGELSLSLSFSDDAQDGAAAANATIASESAAPRGQEDEWDLVDDDSL